MRATTSVEAPGGNATMMRIGFAGYSLAAAAAVINAAAVKARAGFGFMNVLRRASRVVVASRRRMLTDAVRGVNHAAVPNRRGSVARARDRALEAVFYNLPF